MSFLIETWVNRARALWEDECVSKLDQAARIIDPGTGLPYDPPPNPLSQYMLWRGVWDSGASYSAHETVTDVGWAMVANKDTIERPSPQEVGLPTFDLPDIPAFQEQSHVGLVRGGHQYSFTSGGWVTGIQTWPAAVTPDYTFEIELLDITDPNAPIYIAIENPLMLANQWNTISVTNLMVSPGTELLLILNTIDSAANSTWAHPWVYEGLQNTAAPPSGNWNKRQQEDVVRINVLDNDLVDQSVDLAAIVAGSTLTIVDDVLSAQSWRYAVRTVTDLGTYFEYGVVLLETGTGGGPLPGSLTNIGAVIPIPDPTLYEQLPGNWPVNNPTWADVNGLLELSGVPVAAPDDAFGVRLQFQPAVLAQDWDFLSYSSLGSAANNARDARIQVGIGDQTNSAEQVGGASFIDQVPLGIGIGNKIQVSFGPAQPPWLAADGTITMQDNGQYDVRIQAAAQRTIPGGVAKLWAYAEKNGVQSDFSVVAVMNINNERVSVSITFADQYLAGDELKLYAYRDSAGNNDGFLMSEPNLDGLEDAPSALIEITRRRII